MNRLELNMKLPKKLDDIERLVKTQLQESLHLDYKSSGSLTGKKARSEIAKDVSAFANSDGGMIIYGVEEDGHVPVRIDQGVPHEKLNREWLESVIISNIAPHIEDIQISQIPISDSHSLFVIKVPKSFRGPHQERLETKRYYRRVNFSSLPMEDYEIREAYNRRDVVPPLIVIDLKIKEGIVELVISNSGDSLAQDVQFKLPDGMHWHGETGTPSLLDDGIRFFPPGRHFYLLYNSYQELLKDDSDISMQFEIGVAYFHPKLNRHTSEKFVFDLRDFAETIQNESDIETMTKKVVKELKNLVDEAKKIEKRLEPIAKLVSPTGLHLSIPTIENFRHIAAQDGKVEKLDPRRCSAQIFVEVLGVPKEVAWNLAAYFGGRGKAESISRVEGATDEILEKFKHYFIWVEVPKPPPNNLPSFSIKPPRRNRKGDVDS